MKPSSELLGYPHDHGNFHSSADAQSLARCRLEPRKAEENWTEYLYISWQKPWQKTMVSWRFPLKPMIMFLKAFKDSILHFITSSYARFVIMAIPWTHPPFCETSMSASGVGLSYCTKWIRKWNFTHGFPVKKSLYELGVGSWVP